MYVKPNKTQDGELLKVFDPVNNDDLPKCGRFVTATPYWHRRIGDGSVTVLEPIADPADETQEQVKTIRRKKGVANGSEL